MRFSIFDFRPLLTPDTWHLAPNWKRQRKRRSLPLPAFHTNRAAVLLDNLAGYRQTQPRAAALGGESRLKYLFQILRADARSLIRKGHRSRGTGTIFAPADADGQRSAGFHRPESIERQIEKCLLESRGVGKDGNCGPRRPPLDLHFLLPRQRTQEFHRLPHQPEEVHGKKLRRGLTVKMQDVVHRRGQRPQACLDVIDPGLQLRLVCQSIRQEPGKEFQAPQGVSNLMGEQGGNLRQRLRAARNLAFAFKLLGLRQVAQDENGVVARPFRLEAGARHPDRPFAFANPPQPTPVRG